MSYSFKELYNIVSDEAKKAIDKYTKEITELKSINRVDNYVNEYVKSSLTVDDNSFVYNVYVDGGCSVIIEDDCVILGCVFTGKGTIKVNKGSILIGAEIGIWNNDALLEITNSYLFDTTICITKDNKNKIKNSVLIYSRVSDSKCKNCMLEHLTAIDSYINIAGTKDNSLILSGQAILSDSINSLYLIPNLKIGYLFANNMFYILDHSFNVSNLNSTKYNVYLGSVNDILMENGLDYVDNGVHMSAISVDAPKSIYENVNLYIQGLVEFKLKKRIVIEGSLYITGPYYIRYQHSGALKLGSMQIKNGANIIIGSYDTYIIKSYTGTLGNLMIDNYGTFICKGYRCGYKRNYIYEAKNLHIKEEGFYII